MSLCAYHPRMYIKIPRKVIDNLKRISDMSTKRKWEYAGGVDFAFDKNKFTFTDPTFVTSKRKNRVTIDHVKLVWPSLLAFHTHPSISQPKTHDLETYEIFTTLPSDADFEAFIKGYPGMQANIICDAHGYYLIDVVGSAEKFALPLPESVAREMKLVRERPFLCDRVFGEDGLEYHQTTLSDWKHFINYELNYRLNKLFGISIRYFGYNDDTPSIIIDPHSIDA